jgi:hypothetical protein
VPDSLRRRIDLDLEITGNANVVTIAGYEGILTGFTAIYAGLAQVLNEMYKRTVAPLGALSAPSPLRMTSPATPRPSSSPKSASDGDVSYMSSETLLFIVALFNNSHHERSKHYE